MSLFWQAVMLSLLAGLAIPVGGLLASVERFRVPWLERDFKHFVIAFGGGAMLAAVAFVLVPSGLQDLTIVEVLIAFLSGGAVFALIDRWLERRKIAAPQALAMLMDFAPEAVALGAAFAADDHSAVLLAFLIAMQNLPEGFNAFSEMRTSMHASRARVLWLCVGLSLIGPLCAIIGFSFLAGHNDVLGWLMLFASGGILYLIFEDIAPASKIEHHWLPAMGAVCGFAIGLLGHLVVEAT